MQVPEHTLYKRMVDNVARKLELQEEIKRSLLEPNQVHEHTLSLSEFGVEDAKAYRVQFSNERGPYKGGIRFHPDADQEEVATLAALMALKTAVVNIPLGGAKGGVAVDTKNLSTEAIEEIARKWVQAMHESIGPDIDIPAPDMYTNPQVMSYMLDEYENIVEESQPGVVTGKPLPLGGSLGRDIATSQGGVYVLEALREILRKDPNSLSVAVQGFGNAGYHVARLLHNLGYKITAISDSRGGLYGERGLDPEQVWKAKQEQGSVRSLYCDEDTCDDESMNRDDVSLVSSDEILTCACDVLVPAALDMQITEDNMDDIQASIVLELANNPTSSVADEKLHERCVTVIPDILANAGGVTVSYFEWVQNRMQYYWTTNEVHERLSTIMENAFHTAWERAQYENTSLREATYLVGIERLAEATKLRGIGSSY